VSGPIVLGMELRWWRVWNRSELFHGYEMHEVRDAYDIPLVDETSSKRARIIEFIALSEMA